ncbi:glycosyltransferase family 4 protein [Allorhodopirellula solitaria]|uniref:Glycogen synthase n=1 Tax=Allorhodopirellula solitaria TaxID=2527987 RepID=A0A5C5YB49_9BACT|nr:glycosyltransferase family 4 protein [Allorhodopirellula solitaria]TWT72936.1 Glycogen synthase [Allorhodopirellula solitaria]
MSPPDERWMVCQIGAREHYSIARALHLAKVPTTLLTDYWSGGRTWGVPSRLSQRYHADLATADARGFNAAYLRFVASAKIKRLQHWDWIVAQNEWFGKRAADQLARQCRKGDRPTVVFAYSYAAKSIFQRAKRDGCITLLGQIDPGPVEMRLVRQLHERAGCEPLREPPQSYWDNWRVECDLADGIIVNSPWSRDAMIQSGVSAGKILIVPLAYEPERRPVAREREYAGEFTETNPLRILFLGQVNRRKGAAELLGAIQAMEADPVQWTIVGPGDEDLLAQFRQTPRTNVVGPVTRSQAAEYYQKADVFILPTHSDGYALTQLEAASYGLPLITSRFCGEVVTEGQNGILINRIHAEEIVRSVQYLLTNPVELTRMARNQLHSEFLAIPDLVDRMRDAADRASEMARQSTEEIS